MKLKKKTLFISKLYLIKSKQSKTDPHVLNNDLKKKKKNLTNALKLASIILENEIMKLFLQHLCINK